MVKGVNRQVLEICETGSPYFERAFFFVKPEYADTDEKKLRAAAQQVLPPAAQVPKSKKKRVKAVYYWLAGLLASAVGVGTAVVLAFMQHSPACPIGCRCAPNGEVGGGGGI